MEKLSIACIQSELYWEDKSANLEMFEKKIQLLSEGTDLLILPEMFNTGFTMCPETLAETMDGPTVSWMKERAREKNISICGSIAIAEEGKFYNRLIWVWPDGSLSHYDKRHLFGLGMENKHYHAGFNRLIIEYKGWKICPLICYDLRFPAWSRNTDLSAEKKQGPIYDLLLYVANWPERRNHAWKTLLQARAIENQAYVIGLNRVGLDGNGISHSGDSMLCDALGLIEWQCSGKEELKVLELDKTKLETIRRELPFLEDRDAITV